MYIIPEKTGIILIRFENSCWNEIPAFAGVLAFGKRQNKKSEKLKPDQYIYLISQTLLVIPVSLSFLSSVIPVFRHSCQSVIPVFRHSCQSVIPAKAGI